VDILSQHRWDQNPSNQLKPNSDSCNSNSNNRSLGHDNRNNQNGDQNNSRLNKNSSNGLVPTLLAVRLLALLSRADATLVGKPSPTPKPSATPVVRWVTSTRFVTRIFPETAGSSTKLLWLSRTLARMPLPLIPQPTQTMSRLAVDAPRDPPLLLRIAGVTDPMTFAGRVSSSLTLWTNLTSLNLSLASPRPLRLPLSQMSFF